MHFVCRCADKVSPGRFFRQIQYVENSRRKWVCTKILLFCMRCTAVAPASWSVFWWIFQKLHRFFLNCTKAHSQYFLPGWKSFYHSAWCLLVHTHFLLRKSGCIEILCWFCFVCAASSSPPAGCIFLDLPVLVCAFYCTVWYWCIEIPCWDFLLFCMHRLLLLLQQVAMLAIFLALIFSSCQNTHLRIGNILNSNKSQKTHKDKHKH